MYPMLTLTEKQKQELVASRFIVLDTDLVDGETFFKQLDKEKNISFNAFYVKSRFLHAKTTTPAKNGRVYRVLGHFDTPARAFTA